MRGRTRRWKLPTWRIYSVIFPFSTGVVNISYRRFPCVSNKYSVSFCAYSDADGISSKQLSDLIWPDKPKDKVKTRGVAINHLRKILKELDGIELVYEKGCFRFTLSSVFYCDYLRFMWRVVAETGQRIAGQEFLHIVGRGKFVGFCGRPCCSTVSGKMECRLEVLVYS